MYDEAASGSNEISQRLCRKGAVHLELGVVVCYSEMGLCVPTI